MTQIRQEIAAEIRFQQSLLKLGAAGERPSRKRPASQQAEPQVRQLAVWADQLATLRIAS